MVGHDASRVLILDLLLYFHVSLLFSRLISDKKSPAATALPEATGEGAPSRPNLNAFHRGTIQSVLTSCISLVWKLQRVRPQSPAED